MLHQFVPSLLKGDAVGVHTRLVRDLLVEKGLHSTVYAAAWAPEFDTFCRPFDSYDGGAALYQFAVGSGVGDYVARHVRRLAVCSHNVTPPRFFAGWGQPAVQEAAAWGDRQLRTLAESATLGIADSSFNADGLRQAGFRDPVVVPLLMDPSNLRPDTENGPLGSPAEDKQGIDWLFVGRLVPNKAQHDLVLAFALHRVTSPGSRLWLVGRTDSPRYETALRHLIAALDLGDAVAITGPVDDGTLAAYYRNADVFVSASEHEGFCLPLVEAMHHGLPIVAHASSAVAETLGGAGICITDKRPHAIASAVEAAVARPRRGPGPGPERAARFELDRVRHQLWDVLSEWLTAG